LKQFIFSSSFNCSLSCAYLLWNSLFNSDKVLKCDTKVGDGTTQLSLFSLFPWSPLTIFQ
jgi:hypothetical protein